MSIKSKIVDWALKGLDNTKVIVNEAFLYNALYSNLGKGMTLENDSNQKSYVKVGYENNADAFGMANKMAVKAADIPLIPFIGDTDKISPIDPLQDLYKSQYQYQMIFDYHSFVIQFLKLHEVY